jgi:putative flavoprotein involved in K+ transport
MSQKQTLAQSYTVVIVGAGPSGLGTAMCLREIGINDYVILERDSVGASFKHWPKETRFITPSFTSNVFGLPDLNAITPLTSPGLTLGTEHPSGTEYASYLQSIKDYYKIPVKKGVEVYRIEKDDSLFTLHTTAGDITATYVIFAAGEFFYPKTRFFKGSEHTTHTATIDEYKKLSGDEFVIIGGYESGMDAACALVSYGKKVTIIDKTDRRLETSDDPSHNLSPRTKDRLRRMQNPELLNTVFGSEVVEVRRNKDDTYKIQLADDSVIHSKTKPLLAAGFVTSSILIENLITRDNKGNVELNPSSDEALRTPNLFLSGPMVHHGDAVFCFIYKNRQRFAVIAAAIGTKMGLDISPLENYRKYQMYLDDLTCCEGSCGC